MKTIHELEQIASQIRRDILRMVHAVNSGHPGGSMGCTDFFTALYFNIMKYETKFNMNAKNEDVFILSNGHISPVFYSTMARAGIFDVKELSTFRKLNSRLQGHPATHEHLPGIRIASGSLGQGMSVACGVALGKKMDKDTNLVYTLHGDGELQEGQNWEAIMFAAHHKLNNLTAIIDYNKLQSLNTVENTLNLEPLASKFEAFGWDVCEVDGHNHEELAIELKKIHDFKPRIIIAHTTKGKGVSYMENKVEWHYKTPNKEELEIALIELK